MYAIDTLRKLGFYVWLKGEKIRYRQQIEEQIDETLLNKLLAEIIENREKAIEYLKLVTEEGGPDGKPVFILHLRNVPPPSLPTEKQQYFLKKHETELVKLLKNTFVSKEMALEELQNIKSDRSLASHYISELKMLADSTRKVK